MKKILVIAVVLFYNNILFSQIEEKIEGLEDFGVIKVDDKINAQIIIVKDNEPQRVEIKTTDKKIKRGQIKVKSKKGTLNIKMSLLKTLGGKNVYVQIYTPMHKILAIEGSGSAKIKSDYKLDFISEVKIGAYSGAVVDLNIFAEKVNLTSSTGGKLRLMGKAKKQKLYINTSSFYYGDKFKTEEAEIYMNIGGEAEVFASKRIKADIGISSSLRYYGNPKEKEFNNPDRAIEMK